MDKQLAKMHWLLNNNNNNSPQRPPNQPRPDQNGRPNGNGQSPQGGSPVNRWLFIIFLVMLAIYAYSYFNPANTSTTAHRTELTYSVSYNQINPSNITTPVPHDQPHITAY